MWRRCVPTSGIYHTLAASSAVAGLVVSSHCLSAHVVTLRARHIDYIFYSPTMLTLHTIVLDTPDDVTPNMVEPSDHMPLGATFSWGSGSNAETTPSVEAPAGQGMVLVSVAAALLAFAVWRHKSHM
jgi:hypothetical protein